MVKNRERSKLPVLYLSPRHMSKMTSFVIHPSIGSILASLTQSISFCPIIKSKVFQIEKGHKKKYALWETSLQSASFRTRSIWTLSGEFIQHTHTSYPLEIARSWKGQSVFWLLQVWIFCSWKQDRGVRWTPALGIKVRTAGHSWSKGRLIKGDAGAGERQWQWQRELQRVPEPLPVLTVVSCLACWF